MRGGIFNKSLEIFSSVNVNEATWGESWCLHVHHKVALGQQQRTDVLSFLRKDAGFRKQDLIRGLDPFDGALGLWK